MKNCEKSYEEKTDFVVNGLDFTRGDGWLADAFSRNAKSPSTQKMTI